MSLATTFEFLSYGLSNILNRHLRLYNDPARYTAIRDDYPRYHEKQRGTRTFDDFDIILDAPLNPVIGKLVTEKSKDGESEILLLKMPVKFKGVTYENTDSPKGW